ncbi:MAG TPA: sodium:solute symporter family protein [Terriglobales bacterium]|nr:sodium:solute symporter family protein [Terriglobales bacterium]
MRLAPADWLFIVWYFLLSIGLGLYYSKKAGRSTSEYFLGGRSLPWWLLGTSMVATSFSSDTPLAVTGIVIKDGVSGNWLWWNFMLGGTLTVLFFAHLWRRAGVMTEVEFIDLRYSGRPARFLRCFKALYLGLPISCITFGWVTLAMVRIIQAIFDTNGVTAMAVCLGLTIFYTTLSGLWGVVATDMLLFGVAMAGSVILSVVSVEKAGGIGGIVAAMRGLSAQAGKDYLSVFPSLGRALPLAFVVALFVQWWAVYYPGAEPGGGGWSAQRMLAARDPRHAVLGTLWFNIAHYVVRPWPWILTALAALVLAPGLVHAPPGAMEAAYPKMIAHLPRGIAGIVVASLFAAFMSTIESIVNLSGSFLLNDFYKPFIRKGASEKHYVAVSRVVVLVVSILGAGFSYLLGSVRMGWQLVMELSAGIGLVLLLRWYWWRVSAWSEIAALSASAGCAVYLHEFPNSPLVGALSSALARAGLGVDAWGVKILLIVAVTTVAWLAVTFLTPPDDRDKLLAFYQKIRPGGFWGPVARRNGRSYGLQAYPFLGWGLALVTILSLLLGAGKLIFMDWAGAAACLAAGTAAAFLLWKTIAKIDWEGQ